MLQIGTKYAIEALRQDAIRRLKTVFPASLSDFRNYYGCYLEDSSRDHPFPGDTMKLKADDAIAVVELARAFDLPVLLPSALFVGAQLDLENLIYGYTDDHGKLWKLTVDDMYRCLAGQEMLRAKSMKQICFAICKERSPLCRGDNEECQETLYQEMQEKVMKLPNDAQALSRHPWIDICELTDLCQPCKTYFSDQHAASVAEVWASLPEIFDIQGLEWPVAVGK